MYLSVKLHIFAYTLFDEGQKKRVQEKFLHPGKYKYNN